MTDERRRNPLWRLIQSYMDLPTHRYPPKPADLARETQVSDQVISKWKQRPMLPTAEQLSKFSQGTGIDYVSLLVAALQGKGYLPPNENIQLDWPDRNGKRAWLPPAEVRLVPALTIFDQDLDVAANDDAQDPRDEAEETERST